MAKGKILVLLVLAVAAYFVYTAFFALGFEQGLAELRELEEKTNAQESLLIPATKHELQAYKKGLTALKSKYKGSESLRNLFDIKISLAVIQEDLLEMIDDFERANKFSPNCSKDSKLDKVKQLSTDTLQKIDSVLNKRNAFMRKFPRESLLAEEISKPEFEQVMDGVKSGVEQLQSVVKLYC